MVATGGRRVRDSRGRRGNRGNPGRGSVGGMRDGPLLRVVKRLARLRFTVDVAAHRAVRRARGDRPWTLGGECRRCAACCEAPAIAVGSVTWSMPLARRAFLWWQRRVNGFELVRADEDDRSFVFRCTHFDRATRSCDSYDSRPGMCRDYPRLHPLAGEPGPAAGLRLPRLPAERRGPAPRARPPRPHAGAAGEAAQGTASRRLRARGGRGLARARVPPPRGDRRQACGR